MTVSFESTNVSYNYQNRTQEQKDKDKKIVTGGGAIAATTAAANTKAAKSGFDMFSSASKVSKGMKNINETTKIAGDISKKSKGLWAKVCKNAKWAKNAIINWGSKFKNMKFIKPIVSSKLFRGCAGALGYGFGVITLISGLSDISKTASDAINSKISD